MQVKNRVWNAAALTTAGAMFTAAPTFAADLLVPDDYLTIELALGAASAGDTILVGAGTYFEHDLDIDTSVTIVGVQGPDETVIDASNLGRAFIVDADLEISGFTLRNGRTTNRGGAIICLSADLTLDACIFLDNTAQSSGSLTGNGGAIYCKQGELVATDCAFIGNTALRTGSHSSSALGGAVLLTDGTTGTLTGCTFEGNTASSSGAGGTGIGGALFVSGSSSTRAPSNAIANLCAFNDNHSVNAAGAIWIQGNAGGTTTPSTVTLHNSTFEGNSGIDGGAMTVFGAGVAWVEDCTFSNDSAGPGSPGGGAVSAGFFSVTTFIGCEFTGNESEGVGGAVSGIVSTWHKLIRCEFRDNSAGLTGGAVNNGSASGSASKIEMVNCLVACNSTDEEGGGVANMPGGDLQMLNCTIVDNVALGGGGGGLANIASEGSPPGAAFVANSVLWSNDGTMGAGSDQISDPDGGATVVYSIVQDGWFGTGSNILTGDPLFADPGDPCGNDYRQLPGSAAIDCGNNDLVPEYLLHDLDGNPRYVDDPGTPNTGIGQPPTDIGAYEYQGGPPCPGDLTGDGIVDGGDLGLLLGNWGNDGVGDLNEDGTVDGADLGLLLGAWGPCL